MHAHKEAKRQNNLGGELARGSKGLACMPDDQKKAPRGIGVVPLAKQNIRI
jgi:hypothetical protein